MKTIIQLSAFLCLLLFGSCKKEEYTYPNVISEFADIQTDDKGALKHLITDEGKILNIQTRKGTNELKPDTTYRTVSTYELLPSTTDQKQNIYLYAAQTVLSVIPIPANRFTDGMKTDPVDIQRIWRSGNYLNMVLLPKLKDKPHSFHFADNGIVSEQDGTRTLYLTLYHNQNGDYEAFTHKAYLSVPLWAYKDKLREGDKIIFRINTYKEGHTSREFLY